MDSYLARLNADSVVLDLGCGGGSFRYENYPFQVIGIDIHAQPEGQRFQNHRIRYIQSQSSEIPLASSSIDSVVCHHTLEHFRNYEAALLEIRRVLRPEGWLWIAVPNGFGFDDALYRFLFEGGGHVNRFTFDGLIADVHRNTGLELVESCDLFSGFVYLKRPTEQESMRYPSTAHFLAALPEGLRAASAVTLNTITRTVDKLTGSRYSQYGWGFIFARQRTADRSLRSCFNVCRRCGSGCAASVLKPAASGRYFCPNCGEVNLFVRPPVGLD